MQKTTRWYTAELRRVQVSREMGNEGSKSASISSARSIPQAASTADDKIISMEELALHTKKHDCWMLIDGVVYDISKFLSAHPGGAEPLENNAGHDATQAFKDIGSCPAAS